MTESPELIEAGEPPDFGVELTAGYVGEQVDLASGYVDNHDKSFADMIERLFQQFDNRLPLTTIVRVARESRDQLRGSPAGAMPELTERLAIERLTTLAATGLHPVSTPTQAAASA